MIPVAAPFLDFLGDFVLKAALAAYKEYKAQENVKEIEHQKAQIQLDQFIIAYKDFMLRATINPELYDQLRDKGGKVKFPSPIDPGGAPG